MQNKDVLRQLCIRLDYQTLINFGRNSMWIVQVTELFRDRFFWKEKAEYVVQRTLTDYLSKNWVNVFHALSEWKKEDEIGDEDEGIFSPIYALGMNDLDVLRTLIEIVPPRPLTLEDDDLYPEKIKNVEVLDWLLENKYIEYNSTQFSLQLVAAMPDNNLDMVKYVLEKLPNIDYGYIRIATMNAARHGAADTIRYLSSTKYTLLFQDADSALNKAISFNHSSAVAILLSVYEFSQRFLLEQATYSLAIANSTSTFRELLKYLDISRPELQSESNRFFSEAVKYNKGEALQLIIEADPRHESRLTYNLLIDSVLLNKVSVVKTLLRYIDPMEDEHRALLRASRSNIEMFKLFISDPRVPIMSVLNSLLAYMMREAPDSPELMIDALVKEKRVDVAKLEKSTLRSLFSGLGSLIEDKVDGYIAASNLVGRSTNRAELEQVMEEKTLESILLRYLILKRPIGQELVQWMIEQKNREFGLAAANVVSDKIGRDEQLVALEALMLSMLHPTLSLEDIIFDLRAEGVKEEELASPASLVGAYRGRDAL